MPLLPDPDLTAARLVPRIHRLFDLSATKLRALNSRWDPARGAPVFTRNGRYTTRAWTEWTQGFQHGSALLQFDATGDLDFLELGRRQILRRMPAHVTHTGVHDHGFNIVSTYGNLWRLARERRLTPETAARPVCELALRVSGAVQAARWTDLGAGRGFIYSFNGPHSLFVDTLRSLRSLALAHQLGHVLLGERDRRISLLTRLLRHAESTARYNLSYGSRRDAYDRPGRTAQECLFNLNDGSFRCPNTQQGWSPFTTWTRGLAWAILGFAEELEFVASLPNAEIEAALTGDPPPGTAASPVARPPRSARPRGAQPAASPLPALSNAASARALLLRAARATADHYLDTACADGIPMWDTGAPQLHRLGDYARRPADPFNRWEPVDSSAAAITAQGLIRLGNHLLGRGDRAAGRRYRQAGFTIAHTLLREPYLSTHPRHEGLLLHSVYHRPNGWDYIRRGQTVPHSESSIWGDYHLRELAVLLLREARSQTYPTFFDPP